MYEDGRTLFAQLLWGAPVGSKDFTVVNNVLIGDLYFTARELFSWNWKYRFAFSNWKKPHIFKISLLVMLPGETQVFLSTTGSISMILFHFSHAWIIPKEQHLAVRGYAISCLCEALVRLKSCCQMLEPGFSIVIPEFMCKPYNQEVPQQAQNLSAGPKSPQQEIRSVCWIKGCSWRSQRSEGKSLQAVHNMKSIFCCW